MQELPPLPHQDIGDPAPFLPGIALTWWMWLIIIVVALAFIALVTLIIFLAARNKGTALKSGPSYYETSKTNLEKLRESLLDHPLSHIATEASITIRTYLSNTLSEPALFETHEEMLMRKDALQRLPQNEQDRLSALLSKLAEYKYGRSNNDKTLGEQLITDCLDALQGIESNRIRPAA